MHYHESILDAIGDTPLVRVRKLAPDLDGLVLAKCEFLNPGGSVKDRIGPAMIEKAEREGALKPGGTIVEGTSGNTGVGLAAAAAIKGYRTIFTMTDKQSREKQLLLKAFGAEVFVCPTDVAPDDPRSYYSVAKRLAEERANAVYPNQYMNTANPEAHYRSTGPEIWRQTEGKITHLYAGVGTGGTISGIGKYLKEQNPDVKVIGIDPHGSLLKHYHETGKLGKAERYKVEGIGEDIIPRTVWFEVIDEMVEVGDMESFVHARLLTRREGIFAGGSSGSALCGALQHLRKAPARDPVAVVVLPDSGTRYVSKFFDDAWMDETYGAAWRALEAKVP
ncbi:MAG: PLP-dependent cysteine synthase family protein [Thermoplasmatota archaeon]